MAEPFLGVDLPDASMLAEDDYRRMHAVASSLPNLHILRLLDTQGELSLAELRRICRGDDVAHRLHEMQRVGLVTAHQSRIEGTVYARSALAEPLLDHGVTDGVRLLMREEQRAH